MNTNKWKPFKISNLFYVYTGGDKPRWDVKEEGILINSIENQTTNNGIKEKIFFNGKKIFDNFISIVSIGEGGKAFYQEEKGAIFTRVKALIPKFKLNKYIGLFLIPILDLESVRYSYGRVLDADRLRNTEIKLPVDKEGNPDWEFMENYTEEIYKKELSKINNQSIIRDKIKLNINNWRNFKIIDLFDIKKGERLINEDRIKGNIPLITSTSENNGVVTNISYEEFKDTKKSFQDKITIDMFFNVFYHNYNYFSDDNVHTLIPRNISLNKYNYLFLVTVLKKLQYKYNFGRQVRLQRLMLEKIKLPVDKEGNPDWEFMENYIKSLPYSKALEN